MVAEALSKVSSVNKPIPLSDIEILGRKAEQVTRQILADWTRKKLGDNIIIPSGVAFVDDSTNFIVKELLNHFHHFSKEELMYLLVIGHAQILMEQCAAATDTVKYVKPSSL